MLYLSNIVLLVICAVNFRFVKRMYIHIFVGVWLPAQIFLFYGMMIREYTDWLKYTLENNGIFALAAGFKILNYNGLPVLSQINYIVSITETAGYSCVVMIGLWLLYGCLNLCRMLFCKRSTNLKKVIMYVRYIILTVQICLIPNVAYCAFKSLLYSSFDSLAAIAINTCFAIAINFYLIGFIVVLFLITKRTRPSIIMILS